MENEVGEVLECCEKILGRMKTDYSSLIGQEFKIEYEENLVKPYMFMKAVEKSWNVQTKK